MLEKKYNDLVDYIKKLEKVIIAFSGGVDSTFLLKAAKDALGDNVKAVTVKSPYIPTWEVEEAQIYTKKLDVLHDLIHTDIIDEIKDNPKNRCYLCKKAIFSKIMNKAKDENYKYIIDGTNFDDIKDYRPGMVALKELGVVSPLLECEITKNEIRIMSKEFDLPTWNKPAYACLLTRIPFNTKIQVETLSMIEEAEKYIMGKGIKAVRVRVHNDLARVEVDPFVREMLFNTDLLDDISSKIKEIGFKYVTLDMAGYKMGSFNN